MEEQIEHLEAQKEDVKKKSRQKIKFIKITSNESNDHPRRLRLLKPVLSVQPATRPRQGFLATYHSEMPGNKYKNSNSNTLTGIKMPNLSELPGFGKHQPPPFKHQPPPFREMKDTGTMLLDVGYDAVSEA
eukprot:85989_1